MHVKINFANNEIPEQTYENVVKVETESGAFKMAWEAEGPGWVETYIPWHRIRKVEVQRGHDE